MFDPSVVIHSQITKFHIIKKKILRAMSSLYLKWRRREGGLSKVFETDEGGGGRGGRRRQGGEIGRTHKNCKGP